MKWAAVLLAVGAAFSSGAWGQAALSVGGLHDKTIAAEYFGAPDGRLVQARSPGNDPVRVHVVVGRAAITAGNEADLTFRMKGATFADRVSLSQFSSDSDNVSMEVRADGRAGDDSITVGVSVYGGDLAVGKRITFTIPDLQVVPAVLSQEGAPLTLGVALFVSIAPTRTTGTSFPHTIEEQSSLGFALYDIGSALEIALSGMATGGISLMDRKVLAGGTEEAPAVLSLGTLTVVETSPWRYKNLAEQDSMNDPGAIRSSLPGQLVVTARGNFQTDDKVMLGETALERNEDGSFSGGIAIADVGAGIDGVAVTYVPGGVDDLLPATFNTTAEVRYDDPKNASGPVHGRGTGTVQYEGVSVAGYAYGIVKAGGAARTHIRVACIGAMDCSVFANCRDQSGESYFGELGEVPAGGLDVYDSNEIGEALGGGWNAGRGRCDLLSNGALEVQNMLTQGSTEVNNSLVISGGPTTLMVTATSTTVTTAPVTILDRTQ